MPDAPAFRIITGGLGSGKATLIDALAEGIGHMPDRDCEDMGRSGLVRITTSASCLPRL